MRGQMMNCVGREVVITEYNPIEEIPVPYGTNQRRLLFSLLFSSIVVWDCTKLLRPRQGCFDSAIKATRWGPIRTVRIYSSSPGLWRI